MSDHLFVGVDVGASRTKVAILDSQKRLMGHSVSKSGIDFAQTAQNSSRLLANLLQDRGNLPAFNKTPGSDVLLYKS